MRPGATVIPVSANVSDEKAVKTRGRHSSRQNSAASTFWSTTRVKGAANRFEDMTNELVDSDFLR